MLLGVHFKSVRNFDPSINIALVNGGYLHYTEIKKFLKTLLCHCPLKKNRLWSTQEFHLGPLILRICCVIISQPFFAQTKVVGNLVERAFENISEKGDNAENQHFLPFHNYFFVFLKTNSNLCLPTGMLRNYINLKFYFFFY